MTSIILHHHLGLGDHFVCNGLVNYFCEQCDLVYLPCKRHNLDTVRHLYSENPKIQIIVIEKDEYSEVSRFANDSHVPVMKVGFDRVDPMNWDKSFYQQVGLSFEKRYSLFRLPQDPSVMLPVPEEDFILVHNDSSVGAFKIKIESDMRVIFFEKGKSDNLFGWMNLIRAAKEIHCVASSVYHLIDSIPVIDGQKLFFHDLRKVAGEHFDVSQKWSVVQYTEV